MDCYSRFLVIKRVRSTIAKVKQVMSEYRVTETLMSNSGTEFTSKELKTFANQYCFDHIPSSLRYTQSSGLIECMVQTVR